MKKIINVIFGNSNNLFIKFSSASFITAIIFFVLAFISPENSVAMNTFIVLSGLFFSIWLVFTQGSNSGAKILSEIVRLFMFFIIFIYSLYYCIQFVLGEDSNMLGVILSCVGLFFCVFYFISKLADIVELIRKGFRQIKIKLFNTANPATTKFKALIENITAFLVAVGGLTVAVKVIAESLFQVLGYFK